MTERLRAKFYVRELAEVFGPDGAKSQEKVALSAVCVTGSEAAEDVQYYRATPIGNVAMTVENPEAFGFFARGREFYADFSPAPPRCAACNGGGAEWYRDAGRDASRPCPRCGGGGLEPSPAPRCTRLDGVTIPACLLDAGHDGACQRC